MRNRITALILALLASSSVMALTCESGTTKVEVTKATVGAINPDVFQHIDYDSAEAVQQAIDQKLAFPIVAGTFACQDNANAGFLIYAARLAVPGQESHLWVPVSGRLQADLVPAD